MVKDNTRLVSATAAAMRANNQLKTVSSAIETNLTSGLTDIVTGTKSVSQGFKDMGLAIVKSIDEMIIKLLIVRPLMMGLQGFVPKVPVLSSDTGLSLTTTGGLYAHGGVFDAGNVIPFARGGVVDSPTIAPMALFGEAGPEAIVPLRRGSDGNLGIANHGGGGGGINITNHYAIDASGADSGTVERIKGVLADHAKAISGQGKAMRSAQRFQETGVS